MQLRSKPFGEWILVYYDKTKTSEAKLLNLAKTKGCKRASVIRDQIVKSGKSSALIFNPYICPGDTVVLEINSDGSEKIKLELPEGWTCKIPEKISGKLKVYITTTNKKDYGKKSMKFTSGSSVITLTCHKVRKI
jgi:hypothetical protein